MGTSEKDNLKQCPFCSSEVDPLRAAAVSIVDGRIAYFCSNACRETYLQRDENSPPADLDISEDEDVVNDSRSSQFESETEPRAIAKISETVVDAGDTGAFRKVFSTPSSVWELLKTSFLLLHVVEAALLLILILLNFILAHQLAKDLVVQIVSGGAIVFSLGFGIWRDRKNGNAAVLNSIAFPLAAFMMLSVSRFNRELVDIMALAAPGVLLVKSLGRVAEAISRYQSGVLAMILNQNPSAAWRDNSAMALTVRKVAMVLDWARIPFGLLTGGGLFFWGGISLPSALMTTAIILIVLEPRLLRMATGDAHLKVAMLVRQMAGNIRDANAVAHLGQSRTVVMKSNGVLVLPDVRVVDWRWQEGVPSTNHVLSALLTAQSPHRNRYARAIAQYCRQQGARETECGAVEMRAGKGICADTAYGKIHCGSRQYLLECGISTAEADDFAHNLEQSGRRALFVVLNERLAAVFGIDEQICSGAENAVQRMALAGCEPVMISSADVDSATAFGERLGIEHVLFEKTEADYESVLAQFREADTPVIFVGSGRVFEENVRNAACAVNLGGDSKTMTLADVDLRDRTLGDVVQVLEWSKAARRSVRMNLFATLFLFGPGICFAFGWNTPTMTIGLAIAGSAISIGSTFTGPYPTVHKLLSTVRLLLDKVAQLAGLSRRGGN
ncbi:MAG: HAD family hydrolase [Deltaproteobacteria bacterium]|nr:HAD family hydrolase [Deltaproteobacteria bacterium]